MICVRNYRPSVISIGRRLTNSALALATFSPIASLQHLEKLEFIGRKYTTSRFPLLFYIFRCQVNADFFFGRKMSSGWRFHNFSSYLSFMSSACNFLATLFVRRSQDSPSRVYCLLVELKSTFIWEWKCGSGYNGLWEKVQLMAIGQWWEWVMWKSFRWRKKIRMDKFWLIN